MSDASLDWLLHVARRRDRVPDLTWPAAIAAVEMLLWRDAPEPAGELAQQTLADFGRQSDILAAEQVPLPDALILAALHAGDDIAAVLRQAADLVPDDSVLGRHLRWQAEQLARREPHTLLLGAVDRPNQPLRPRDRELATRELRSLTDTERERLWVAAHSKGQYTLARRLLDDTGQNPPRWPIAYWMAARMVADGEITLATSILTQALPLWHPFKLWNILPIPLMIRPELRPAMTDELHAAALARVDITKIPGLKP